VIESVSGVGGGTARPSDNEEDDDDAGPARLDITPLVERDARSEDGARLDADELIEPAFVLGLNPVRRPIESVPSPAGEFGADADSLSESAFG
jgi:hypothetical protein